MSRSNRELPALLRASLPREAQELYRAVYNRTRETLSASEEADPLSIEVNAHEAARLAVEYEFSMDEKGNWRRNPVGEEMKRRGIVEPDSKPTRKP